MPTLILHTNVPLDEARTEELGIALSRFASEASRKPEQWVMTLVRPGQSMRFAGADAPCAFVEFKSIDLPDADMPAISADLCALLREHIALEPARVYIEFTSAEARRWGWNGGTF
ncbi:MAG: phenylpyruvate tautomerase MIF-related protein [Pseudomonadota bacterium]